MVGLILHSTPALASIRADNFKMDTVFWSEYGCNGSYMSYMKNIADDGCSGPCMNLENYYGAVQMYDKSHTGTSTCYFYQSNNNNCSGSYTNVVHSNASQPGDWTCVTFYNSTTKDLLPQGSVQCFRGVC